METLPLGSDWSNRSPDGKRFKNLSSPDRWRAHPCEWLAFILGRIKGLPGRPQGGFKAFGERWYKPCNVSEQLQSIRADPIDSMNDCVFWIGHATTLLCLRSGTNILFDPIFSKRCSPYSFAGPARRFPPATTIEELPNIDIITISHNHYDHLDKASILELVKRFPAVKIVVPLCMEDTLASWGISASSIISMDWWEELHIRDVVIGCTPAQHWCGRWFCDKNDILWCGWCVGWSEDSTDLNRPAPSTEDEDMHSCSGRTDEIPTPTTVEWNKLKTYFFTGDTAFNENMFRIMHKRFTRIDMAALPIGAYGPRRYMRTQHIDPESAVSVFEILQVKQAFGVHWATFELAEECIDDPPKDLAKALQERAIDSALFRTIPIGAHVLF